MNHNNCVSKLKEREAHEAAEKRARMLDEETRRRAQAESRRQAQLEVRRSKEIRARFTGAVAGVMKVGKSISAMKSLMLGSKTGVKPFSEKKNLDSAFDNRQTSSMTAATTPQSRNNSRHNTPQTLDLAYPRSDSRHGTRKSTRQCELAVVDILLDANSCPNLGAEDEPDAEELEIRQRIKELQMLREKKQREKKELAEREKKEREKKERIAKLQAELQALENDLKCESAIKFESPEKPLRKDTKNPTLS